MSANFHDGFLSETDAAQVGDAGTSKIVHQPSCFRSCDLHSLHFPSLAVLPQARHTIRPRPTLIQRERHALRRSPTGSPLSSDDEILWGLFINAHRSSKTSWDIFSRFGFLFFVLYRDSKCQARWQGISPTMPCHPTSTGFKLQVQRRS